MERYLQNKCKLFGRFHVDVVRRGSVIIVTPYIGLEEPIQTLIWPDCPWYNLPNWFRDYIDTPIGSVLQLLRLDRLIYKYQECVFNYFTKKANKKWPMLRMAINEF